MMHDDDEDDDDDDDVSCWMLIYHYEAPRGPERAPFRVAMAIFAMGTMIFSRGPFLPLAPFKHDMAPIAVSKPIPSKWEL